MLQNLQNLFFAADPIFPGIAFFKSEVRNRITSSGATVESTGLSISIPAGTLQEEDSTDLLIRSCFSGPFELPAESSGGGTGPADPAAAGPIFILNKLRS